ncbi:hypothetical protein, partial [uncultured Bacteroides sp.]|uniref:hypothetical protein n=1 Tax=uncultured Bacteroides sp. TaxID=162156 RepID=UPI00267066E0
QHSFPVSRSLSFLCCIFALKMYIFKVQTYSFNLKFYIFSLNIYLSPYSRPPCHPDKTTLKPREIILIINRCRRQH